MDSETLTTTIEETASETAPAADGDVSGAALDDSGLPQGETAPEPVDEFEGEFSDDGFTPEATAGSASSAQALAMDRRVERLITIGVLTNSNKWPLKVANRPASNGKLRSVGKAIHGAADRASVTVQCVTDGKFTYARLITETPVRPDVTTTNPSDKTDPNQS